MAGFLDTITNPDFYIPFLDLVSASTVALWSLATTSAEHEKIKGFPSVSRNSKKRRMREVAKAAIRRAEKLARKRRNIARAAAVWLIVSSALKIWSIS